MVLTIEESKDNAFRKANAWSFPVDTIDPAGADDYFWHILNNGKEAVDVVGFSFNTTVVGVMQVERVSGDAGGSPATVKPVNARTGLQVLVENVTCLTDPDITGLTTEGIEEFIGLSVDHAQGRVNLATPIRINTGQSLAGLWVPATGILSGSVHFRKIDEPQEN